MKIEILINDFLSLSKMNKKPGAYNYDKSKLNHFKKWLDQNKGYAYVAEITNHTINDYVFHLKKTCINNTINKHIKVLKLFYKTMNIDFSYLQEIKNLRERVKTFDMIDFTLLDKMTSFVLRLPNTINNNLLYKGIYLLLLDTGARINEILHIEKNDVDLKKNRILLKETKNSVDRYVYITDEISKSVINSILLKKTKHKYLLHDYLKNKKAEYGVAKYFISRILKERFNFIKLHPHMFRHAMATYWIENGADPYFVQKMLGHKNFKTTERYLHVSEKHKQDTYNKVAYRGKSL